MTSPRGKIHSIQSLGTVDGPGVRFVAFMQGCPLRCGCCHNPDTWEVQGGAEYTANELLERALRCRSYFGEEGGVTLSGGEPLLQPEFAREYFSLCHAAGINTCIDTSGCILTEQIKALLCECDRVLLDLKYSTDKLYRENVGCSLACVLEFLEYLDRENIKTTLRQVVIPTLNDTQENTAFLKETVTGHKCIDKVELLPFKKICKVKYDSMGIDFPFDKYSTPDRDAVKKLERDLNEIINSVSVK